MPLHYLEKAKQSKKDNKKLVRQIKSKRKSDLDSMFHIAHQNAFDKIDCLECANCCKTTGPRVLEKDISRISKALRYKPKQFIEKYLRIDEDGDYVFQTLPCPFLASDNKCNIYDIAPKACREYPHTDRVNQKQLLSLHIINSVICPAVADMFDQLKA